jgi:hypothetical protein
MDQIKLLNSRDFFEQVLRKNYEDFISKPSSFQTAINAVTSLYHMHEWVFTLDKAHAENVTNASFSKSYDVWTFVENAVPKAGHIRDVSNASKHVELTRQPSTSMTHIANTSIISYGYGEGGYGVGRFGAPTVMLDEAQGPVSLDECATVVFDFWKDLVDRMHPTASEPTS